MCVETYGYAIIRFVFKKYSKLRHLYALGYVTKNKPLQDRIGMFKPHWNNEVYRTCNGTVAICYTEC